MKYYYHPFSPNCRKIDALLNSLNLDEERIVVELGKGEQMSPEFLALNPNGMIPVLEDNGKVVLESNAITIYLAEKAESPLWPNDRSLQLETLQWMFWEQSHFMYACGIVFFQRLIKPMIGQTPDEERIKEGLTKFRRTTAVLNQHLETRKFLLGDELTLADWVVASHLTFAEKLQLPLEDFPKVQTWRTRLDENAAWKASEPKM